MSANCKLLSNRVYQSRSDLHGPSSSPSGNGRAVDLRISAVLSMCSKMPTEQGQQSGCTTKVSVSNMAPQIAAFSRQLSQLWVGRVDGQAVLKPLISWCTATCWLLNKWCFLRSLWRALAEWNMTWGHHTWVSSKALLDYRWLHRPHVARGLGDVHKIVQSELDPSRQTELDWQFTARYQLSSLIQHFAHNKHSTARSLDTLCLSAATASQLAVLLTNVGHGW